MHILKKFLLLSIALFALSIHAAEVFTPLVERPNTPWVSNQNARHIDAIHEKGATVQATNKLVILLRVDDLFQFPSSTRLLDPSRKEVLEKATQLIRSYDNRKHIVVSGHTDNVGTDRYKLKHSYDQASTVASYLWSHGVPLENLVVIGCADTEPVASNKTSEGSAANRRIEIEIR